MKKIVVFTKAGEFAENKDIAKKWRDSIVIPEIDKDNEVEIDFTGVTGVTQSFIHALIAEAIRKHRTKAFDKLIFSNANGIIRQIITTVFHYMQESLNE